MLGAYVVQRRMAFIGDALAHTTLPGLVVAYLCGWNLLLGGFVAAIITALVIGWTSRKQTIKEDTAIGVAFTGMFALGVLLMSHARSFRDLSHMLFGNILGVSGIDLALMAGVAFVVLSALFLFHKELELSSFDRTHAQVIGIRTDALNYLLLVLLALAIVTGIQAIGVILTRRFAGHSGGDGIAADRPISATHGHRGPGCRPFRFSRALRILLPGGVLGGGNCALLHAIVCDCLGRTGDQAKVAPNRF